MTEKLLTERWRRSTRCRCSSFFCPSFFCLTFSSFSDVGESACERPGSRIERWGKLKTERLGTEKWGRAVLELAVRHRSGSQFSMPSRFPMLRLDEKVETQRPQSGLSPY